jgi:tripartite ATP-independent transporter DctM subunit
MSSRAGGRRTRFFLAEAVRSIWKAKYEVLMPAIVLASYFGGFATLVETAALTVGYAVFVTCVIQQDLSVRQDLPRITLECATLVGGFLIIVTVALGLTNYLVHAEVPNRVLEWVRVHVQSPITFILALNLFLIVVGALMDIYSAILVIVPLIVPIGVAYGIDPAHLGVIFLSNMELGYLMPPMGENLFLSASRFNQSLMQVYRSTLPYLAVLFLVVLGISYAPLLAGIQLR